MSLDQDPNVGVARKDDGAVQSLDHAQQPWSPPETGLHGAVGPKDLAHQYLRMMADEFHIPEGSLGNTPMGQSALTGVPNTLFGL